MKPIVNPSRLSDFYFCKLLYNELHNKHVDFSERLDPRPELGTLIHEGQAAIDLGAPWKPVVKKAVQKARNSIHYSISQAAMLDQLEREAIIVIGGGHVTDGNKKRHKVIPYSEWREQQAYSTKAVEKRIWADVGPVIIAPKLDRVVTRRNTVSKLIEWWVIEDKSTGRDDKNWELRWKFDGQTTCQLLAAETHFKKDFEGVMVQKILITRQNSKSWDKKHLPQPLNKVERHPSRWVSKPPSIRALYMEFLEEFAAEFAWRNERASWPATGFHTRFCDMCRFKPVCSEAKNARSLVSTPKDDIDKEYEKRAKRETARHKAQMSSLRKPDGS